MHVLLEGQLENLFHLFCCSLFVHKVSTSFFFSVKFEKFYLALLCGRLAINSGNCAIFFQFLFDY